MIRIDLVPDDKKKKRKKQFAHVKLNLRAFPLLIGGAGLIVAVHLVIILFCRINETAYARMSAEWKNMGPDKNAAELIKRENIDMAKDAAAIESLMGKKILWYRKLNQLSDLLPAGIWYARLSLEKKITFVQEPQPQTGQKKGAAKTEKKSIETRYLCIEGEVSAMYGGELAAIGKFIDSLKNDKDYFADFSNIELDSTELHTLVDTDVMRFRINCYFKKESPNEPGKI